MIFLEKQITNVYSDTATVHKVVVNAPEYTSNSNEIVYPISLDTYTNVQAYLNGYRMSDTFSGRKYVVTDEEVALQGDVNTPSKDKIVMALVSKIMESVPHTTYDYDEEGNVVSETTVETNVFTGLSGTLGFQDATIINV